MAQQVTFGLIYDFRNPEPWQQPWADRYRAILEQIAWVDSDLAFSGVSVTEHHFYEDGYMPSTMVVCAAIASRTQRVTVGTNLIQLPLHYPVRLAEDALVNDGCPEGDSGWASAPATTGRSSRASARCSNRGRAGCRRVPTSCAPRSAASPSPIRADASACQRST
jgi:hypothetical protein